MWANKKLQLFFFSLLLFILILGASFVLAQEGNPLEIEYPTVPGAETPVTTTTFLPDYIKYIFNLSLGLMGLVVFGILVYGGLRYSTSAGNPTKIKDAKSRIFAGILGLIILLFSYLILTTINPQLVFLHLPVLEKKPEVPEAPELRPEEQILTAIEIPIGKLIDGVGEEIKGGSTTSPKYKYEGALAKTRLGRIQTLSGKVWHTSKEIQEISEDILEASEELKALTDGCSCSNCTIYRNQCAKCPSKGGPCTGCRCDWGDLGPGRDPCPGRERIQELEGELVLLADQLPPLKTGLKKSKEKLELEKEKLSNALAELNEGEKMMRECLGVRDSKVFALLSFYEFWNSKEALEYKLKLVKKIEVEKPWKAIDARDDSATFYCTQQLTATPLKTETPTQSEGAGTKELKIICEPEIPVGRIIYNAEDIGQGLVINIEKIMEEASTTIKEVSKDFAEGENKEKENAEYLADLPDPDDENPTTGCKCWGTAPGCYCACCYDCCCLRDCECCCPAGCVGSSCLPVGEIPATLRKIQNHHYLITAASKNITVYNNKLDNLIGGERKPTWAQNIIEQELPEIRQKFNKCVTPAEDWAKAFLGEKALEKLVLDCQVAELEIAEKYLIKPGALSESLEKCPLPKCVNLTKCATSTCSEFVGATACGSCGAVSQPLATPFCIESKYKTEKVCPTVEELKKYLSGCLTNLLCLPDKEVCDQKYSCCDELNFFCCHTD